MDGTGWFNAPDYIGMETAWDKIHYNPQFGEAVPWDFSRYTPQVVIVAIGQNDSNPQDYMKEDYNCEKAVLWRKKYKEFIEKLRRQYPDAHIICITILLCHDAAWDRSIDQVCCELADDKVTHYMFRRTGKGTPGHLRIPEAEEMAEELTIGFLGGSIMQGSLATEHENAYAYRVFTWWKNAFPKAQFHYVNGGIGGTTSHYGVSRAVTDVLMYQPDFVVVDFSVNDEADTFFQETYEGVIRKLLSWTSAPAVLILNNVYLERR